MGYRSDVFIGTTQRAYEEYLDYIEKTYPGDSYYTEIFDHISYIEIDGEKYVKLLINSIKWYESYDDIQLIMKFLLSPKENEVSAFIRIGEEYKDIEIHGDNDLFDAYVNRDISFY